MKMMIMMMMTTIISPPQNATQLDLERRIRGRKHLLFLWATQVGFPATRRTLEPSVLQSQRI